MRSRRLLLRHAANQPWPSPHGIFLVFLTPGPPESAEALVVPAAVLTNGDLLQPDAELLADLAAHHPPVRGPLLLFRTDVAEVLASLDRDWADLGADWDAVAESVVAGVEAGRLPAMIATDLGPVEVALLGEPPTVVTGPDRRLRMLGRKKRERWRAELTAELVRLLGERNPPE